MSDNEGLVFYSDKPVRGRRCGECTLCCKLVPVEQGLDKPAGQRCKYQSHKGCKVYDRLELVSPSCRVWSCRWLMDEHTGELHRPDRSHYVVDCMIDYIGASYDDGTPTESFPALQVWCDPDHPDAHRDPALRRYIERVAKDHGMVTIVRFGRYRGLVLFPPSLSSDGQWHEKESMLRAEHSEWTNPMQRIHDIADAMRRM